MEFRGRWKRWTIPLAVLFVGVWLTFHFWPRPSESEIGVFFPGTSPASWVNFASAVEHVARERGLPYETTENSSAVQLPGGRLVFRWYRDIGLRGLQARVRSLSLRPQPPIALIGAENSRLTDALARELAEHVGRGDTPVLLMTQATKNDLLDIYPERSFRFGFRNAAMARAVVDRYEQWLSSREEPKAANDQVPEVLVVRIADNPFSSDLAASFEQELVHRYELGPEQIIRWSLSTSTESYDQPTAEERRLASEIVERIAADPDRPRILVLPFGSDPYRRFCRAFRLAAGDSRFRGPIAEAQRRLVIFSGDSMDYYDFEEPHLSGLLPAHAPGPILFFAHANPIDPKVPAPSRRSIPARSMDLEIVRTLLDVLQQGAILPDAAGLADRLAEYRGPEADGDTTYFDHRERAAGGGAILAVPVRDAAHYDFQLPKEWER